MVSLDLFYERNNVSRKPKHAASGLWTTVELLFAVHVCVVLLQDSLPLPQPLSYGEAGNHAVDLGSPLAHVVLNVENKRLLAEVRVHDLARSLKADSGVQVGLEDRADRSRLRTENRLHHWCVDSSDYTFIAEGFYNCCMVLSPRTACATDVNV